mmetsp:Transcript_20646/g.57876  ORF Transcript_20646/g.57876 Transcript_20646/m.57876 type:complete len:233 (-) Transcript_20646:836-1534(-)
MVLVDAPVLLLEHVDVVVIGRLPGGVDPEAAAVLRRPPPALRALETVDQEGRLGLVHAEALPLVVRVAVRALLHREQPLGRGCAPEIVRGEVRELVFDAVAVDRRVPARPPLRLLAPEGGAFLGDAPAHGVERGPELVVELLRVTGELRFGGPALGAARLVFPELVLVGDGLGPLLQLLAVLAVLRLEDLRVGGDHGAAEDVDLQVHPPLLLALPLLRLVALPHRLLALLLG